MGNFEEELFETVKKQSKMIVFTEGYDERFLLMIF